MTITLYAKYANSTADKTWQARSNAVPARLRPWLASMQMKSVQARPPQKKPMRNTDALAGPVAPAFAISAPPTAANQRIALGEDTASSMPRMKLRR